ncbi:ATP-binding cassette domain-containing protein [Streptomyces sp. NPDC048604]|uniref:ATP-binding cassette domain-containing protein n=1 Tax=Streptomyces sp. NPDC048604 TaxID=3365578 RepID=UPI003713540C
MSKHYGEHRVLDDVSIEFPSDHVSYIMGRNGTGKTTLFKCLLGLESHAGNITFDGKPLGECRHLVYTVFDDCPFYPHLNGYENLSLHLGRPLGKREVEEAARDVLTSQDLRRRVGKYSYGQRKKLSAVGMALSGARFILLDELANGMDFESVEWLQALVARAKKNATIIATGHQFDFYHKIADSVHIIAGGHLERADHDSDDPGSLESLYRERILCDLA